jgi:ribose-phosphate pyrophosphokinase
VKIIGGPASQSLAQRVSRILEAEMITVGHKMFPDSESYFRIMGDVRGEDVAIIQTTSPPQDTRLIQLLLLSEGVKDVGARSITAVVPYLAYSRQDKRFMSGEVVSVISVLKIIRAMGVDKLITVNVHSPKVLSGIMEIDNLSAITLLAEHMKEMGLENAFSLAPDVGAMDIVRESASVLDGGFGWLEKVRDRVTGKITIKERAFDVKGKDAIVFDDMISTGGTTSSAVRILKKQGARRVYAACVHPLMVGNAKDKITNSGADGIVGTDTVPGPYAIVSVASIIAEALDQGGE